MSNPILPPDHNNYYAFGPAWKDRTNGVTDLSAQTGSGNVDLSRNEAARHAHQSQLLQARLNTLLDVINTPIDTGKASVGGMNLPYVRQPISALRNAPVLPSISRGRPFTGKSFDEFNAGKKLMEEYSRCDPAVREGFLTELVKVFTQNENTRIGDAIGTLLDDLQDMPGGQHQNLGALRKQRVLLQQMQASAESRQGLSRLGARAKLFFGGKDAELRKVERKINAIENPSSYELHRAANGGDKVSNTPLYMKELRNRNRRASNDNAPLQTGRDIQNFTAQAFDNLAGAIRRFQDLSQRGLHPHAMEQEIQTLRNAAKPILYSKERVAVHRFIRDMMRQLKRAGVPAEELKGLNDLIPDEPGSLRKVFQSVARGTGKQMGLQDEAERMAKALPRVLELASTYREQLKNNLMQFDLYGVTSLRDTLLQIREVGVVQAGAVDFVQSQQGKSFVDAIIVAMERRCDLNDPRLKRAIDNLKNKETRKDPYRTIYALSAALSSAAADISGFIENMTYMNQHLFMVTSDTEFWDKEAVDKVGTRLTENGNDESKSRMFKQMKMRAAALGINEEDADALMKQGIRNTLRNRSMTVAGTKIFGLAGSVAGNISSSPISAPLAANPKTAFLALPGLLDAVLMPTGWAAALGPGAIYGKTVLKRQKKARLAETGHHTDAVNVSLSNTSASPDVNATYTGATHKLKIGGKAIIQIGGKEKPALTPMHISGRRQFTGTHTRVFQGMGKELASLVTGPVQYALWQGPQDAWKDLKAHNDPKQAARLQAGPPSPAFINTAPEYMERRSARTASNPPSPPRYAHVQTPQQYYATPVTPQSTPYAHAWTSTSVQNWSQYVARAQYHGNFGALRAMQ